MHAHITLDTTVPQPEVTERPIDELAQSQPDFEGRTAVDGLRHMHEQRVADLANYDSLRVYPTNLTDGPLTLISYRDGRPGMDDLTKRITRNRQVIYKKKGLLETSAKEVDKIRGPGVEFYALLQTTIEESGVPIASLRKIHTTEAGAVEQSPSFVKFEEQDALDPEEVEAYKERAAGRKVVEIGALWKEEDFAFDAQLSLYRRAIQDSIERDEIWFMGVVNPVHRTLTRTFGPRVIRTIGEPIAVEDEDARKHVRINPAYVDPKTFFDDMLDGVEADKLAGDFKAAYKKEYMISFFLKGLNTRLLSDSTIARLRPQLGVVVVGGERIAA